MLSELFHLKFESIVRYRLGLGGVTGPKGNDVCDKYR